MGERRNARYQLSYNFSMTMREKEFILTPATRPNTEQYQISVFFLPS